MPSKPAFYKPQSELTPLQRHRKKWIECTRCDLCEQRKRVVLVRGSVPAPILFVGEAPGASEDVLGKPFCGPAGKLLDQIIEQAIDGQYDYALTNLVGCIPKGDDGDKTMEPPEEAIKACQPRLIELGRLVKPRLVVTVGKLSRKWVHGEDLFGDTPIGHGVKRASWLKGEFMRFCDIIHPAAILRMDVSQQGLAIQRCIVALEDAIVDL